jgi:acetyl-CoA acetyltransferase
MGKIYGRSATDFAAEAVALALADAGLEKRDVDGLLVNVNLSPDMNYRLQMALGLEDLRLVNAMSAAGSTAISMLQYASLAIAAGLANTVVLVFADAPLKPKSSALRAYSNPARALHPLEELRFTYGSFGANPGYAAAAQRHMHLYGTTSEQLGAIAVAQRAWARMNPAAQMREPMTLQDHQDSRWIIEPLRLLDCCLVSNGAVALVVTSDARARLLRQPPVDVLATAQAAPGDNARCGRDPAVTTGAAQAGPAALARAGVKLHEVDILELYDCYTYTVLVTLEDYGFCRKGEGGPFVADGRLGPDGELPTNTGGGQLSAFYMWGMTPLAEAVIQLRGHAGERQVTPHDVALVSGNGGILNYHATAVLSANGAVR